MNLIDSLPTDLRVRLTPEVFALLAEATTLHETVPLAVIIQFLEMGLADLGTPGTPEWEASVREWAGRVAEYEPADFEDLI